MAGGAGRFGNIAGRVHGPRSGRRKLRWTRSDLAGYLFVLPSLAAVFLFFFYSSADVLVTSFFRHQAFRRTGFAGLGNYIRVLNDTLFWKGVVNTLYMGALGLLIGLPFSLVIASLIKELPRGQGFFKSLFFIPIITSLIAATLMFQFILYPDRNGLVNVVLGLVGIRPLRWFASPTWAPIGVVLLNLWRGTGYNVVIWLAGLLSIPVELYEAAEIDGASRLRRWWSITIPSLEPIFVFLLVTGTIGALRRFAEVFAIGGEDGVPGGSLMTVVLYIYRYIGGADSVGNFGVATAASILLFVMIIALTILNSLATRSRNIE
jgi:multiple sugar transport system permease protein/cellobiose transport system permease protein